MGREAHGICFFSPCCAEMSKGNDWEMRPGEHLRMLRRILMAIGLGGGSSLICSSMVVDGMMIGDER